MKRLLHYLSGYKLESILGPLFKMLEASFELFVPLVVASMIDVGIKQSNAAYILRQGGLLILLGIIGLACSLTAQYFAAKASVSAATCLRNDLFQHISNLSYTEIDTVGTSTLITRMTSDINQVQTGINMVLRLFLRSPFVVFGAMIMAFTVDVKAAMAFVVVIPLLSVVVFGILLISMPLYKKVQKQLDRVMLTTRENLMGVRVIRAFNRQKSETARFEEENPVTYIMINFAIIAVVWIGALQVGAGIITQGKVVALVNYMSQILVELVKLANLMIIISKSVACMNRVDTIFKMEPSIKEKNKVFASQENSLPKLVFDQVSFLYAGAKEESLSGIDFSVKKGETIGIIGGTGSGKSTVVNLIPRFYDVALGQVSLDGRDVRDYPLEKLREKIGVVPQKAVLFKGSLRENMQWGKKDASD